MSTIPRNGHLTLTRPICPQCVKLQEEIKRLREEKHRLQVPRRRDYQQRQIDEGYFGSSTPSSKKPFKANTKAERNNGGGRVGHRGYGRTSIDPREVPQGGIIVVDTEHVCPDCHVALESLDLRDRTLTEVEPVQVKKVLYQLTRRRCPECRRVFRAKAPGVLPKFKQSNSLLAHVATEHYLHQVTFGHLAGRLGISEGSLINAMHHAEIRDIDRCRDGKLIHSFCEVMMNFKTLILPERKRVLTPPFAWIDRRFLFDGFLAALGPEENLLYFFLVLAADRDGLSFYSYDKICTLLQLDVDAYVQARDGLIRKQLLAFDGRQFQVLALPQSGSSRSSTVPRQPIDRHRNVQTLRELITRLAQADTVELSSPVRIPAPDTREEQNRRP